VLGLCYLTICPNGRQSIITFDFGRIDGDWERIHEQLRQWVRAIEDRHPSPSAAVLDSQSVETATMIHQEVGYDAGKQVKGRKRHLLVDTLGLLIIMVGF
jgi:putative transposase